MQSHPSNIDLTLQLDAPHQSPPHLLIVLSDWLETDKMAKPTLHLATSQICQIMVVASEPNIQISVQLSKYPNIQYSNI